MYGFQNILSLNRLHGVVCFGQPLPRNKASQIIGASNNAVYYSQVLWGGPSVVSLLGTDSLARAEGPRPLTHVPGSWGWLSAQVLGSPAPPTPHPLIFQWARLGFFIAQLSLGLRE